MSSATSIQRAVGGFAIAIALVACGGMADATDAGSNDAALHDQATLDVGSADGGLGASCPQNQPKQGGSCSLAGLQCEYGSDPRVSCNVVATCDSSHQWMVVATDLLCSFTDGGGGCPAKQADVAVGQSCSPLNLLCAYPDGVCGCTRIAHQYDRWACDKPSAPLCPYPRPRLGVACSQDLQECDYGTCTSLGGISQNCVNGTWHQVNHSCPPN